jgi:hypothetical protein
LAKNFLVFWARDLLPQLHIKGVLLPEAPFVRSIDGYFIMDISLNLELEVVT